MQDAGRSPEVHVDAAARRLAVETHDRPVLVEAGAGTGKTRLLVERVLFALRHGVARMSGVVAISFTEKAAAELRLRLRQSLEDALRKAPVGLERERLDAALRQLDRAQISTIHAFAAAILRERPLEAKLDPQFRMLDELEAASLRRSFWSRWVDSQLAGREAESHLRAALLAGVRLEPELEELAVALYEQRDLAEGLPLPRPAADLQPAMHDLRRRLLECVAHAEAHCREGSDPGLVKLRRLGQKLEALDDLEPASWPGFFLQEMALDAQAGRRDAWDPGEAAVSKAQRRALRGELEALQQRLASALLGGVLGWLESFRAAYDAEKIARGVLDFQDLLLHARRMLRDDLAARRDLAGRIEMLCVDEFQDTDPLQAEMVLFLAEEGGAAVDWRQVRLGKKLFLVGDPKQSIYRFRRADLEVYGRCRDRVRDSGGLVLDIVQNFRSRPAILHWVNGVFEPLFAPREGAPAEPRHVPLVAAEPAGGGPPAVWILRPAAGTAPPEGADAARRAEAEGIARWLGLAFEARWRVRDRGGPRPLAPGDVALLFGRTSGIEHYEDVLRGAGIPFRQEGGKLFFRRQEVRDVLQALGAIDDPRDELSIVAALRSSLFGASDEALWLHRSRYAGFDYLQLEMGSPLELPLALLSELHATRHELGVSGTIARLLDRTGARAVYGVRPQGAQALVNFDMLQRHARAFESGRPAGLREFVRSLRELDEEAPRLAEWSPEEDPSDRVRLLTVHMAKGLEFPCVVLANLGARGSAAHPSVVADRLEGRLEVKLQVAELGRALATAGYDAAVDAERCREQAEERRLLYVAATRARDLLVVPCFGGAHAEGYMKALREVPGALGEGRLGALPEPSRLRAAEPEWVSADWCVASAADLPPLARPRAELVASSEIEVWLRRRTGWAEAHERRLRRGMSGASIVRVSDAQADADADSESNDSATSSRCLLVVRHVLERAPDGAGAVVLEAYVAEAAAVLGAPGTVVEALALVQAARSHALEKRARQARSAWRGLNLTMRLAGGGLVESRLDLAFEEADGITLVDYSVEPIEAERLEARAAALEESLLLRGLCLQAAGKHVREAGRMFLRLERYVPVVNFESKLGSLRAALEART